MTYMRNLKWAKRKKNQKRRLDSCYMRCVEKHEEYHLKQIKTWCPWICECSPDKVFDVGYGGDKKLEAIWECPAIVVAILCLKEQIKEFDRRCDLQVLQQGLDELIEYMKQECPGTKIDKAPPDPPVYPNE